MATQKQKPQSILLSRNGVTDTLIYTWSILPFRAKRNVSRRGRRSRRLLQRGKSRVVGWVIMESIIYKNFWIRSPRLFLRWIKSSYILSCRGRTLMISARNMGFILKVCVPPFVMRVDGGSVFASYEGSEIEGSCSCSYCEGISQDCCSNSHSIYFAKGTPCPFERLLIGRDGSHFLSLWQRNESSVTRKSSISKSCLKIWKN